MRLRRSSPISNGLGRGFTLVELMVALAAGIAVAGAAYVLSKSSMEVFNQEARLSSAQFAATMGMNRMVGDLQRAGFQMSPNINKDSAKQCNPNSSAITHTNLKAIQILQGRSLTWAAASDPWGTGAAAAAALGAAGVAPDVIRIAGNFSSTEQFEFRTIQTTQVYISMARGSMQRTLRQLDLGGPALDEIFKVDRWVRIVDGNGRENYRKITGIACAPGCNTAAMTSITLTLNQAPNTDGSCGPGASRGLINPVSIVDYWVGQPTFANNKLGTASGATVQSEEAVITPQAATDPYTGEYSRTELVRSERIDDGTVAGIADSTTATSFMSSEVVSEYVVDLAAGATVRTLNPATPLIRYAPGDPAYPTYTAPLANPPEAAEPPPPQRFVSLQVRLSARSRVPDREAPIVGSPNGRYDVFGGRHASAKTTSFFARVRTFSMEINLPNLANSTW